MRLHAANPPHHRSLHPLAGTFPRPPQATSYNRNLRCALRPIQPVQSQFNRETLQKSLSNEGIAYVFLGRELGARSDNSGCYINGKVQYNYLADEPIFLEGLKRLRNGIARYRVALMCAEKDPLTCHRTILVCREMRSSALEIEHILADGTIETNSAAERRLMSMTGLIPDMLCSEQECIERAYDKQASSIAYMLSSEDPEPN